jgi:hypothetical protein
MLTPLEVITKAATWIETYGWHRGALFDPTSPAAYRPACMLGALVATAGADQELYQAACKIIAEHILSARPYTPQKGKYETYPVLLMDYNDRRADRVGEVIAVMRGAANAYRRAAAEIRLPRLAERTPVAVHPVSASVYELAC